MQMLLLTAMTLLGFYLCFKEIRRISVEMAALRDQVTEDVAAAAAAAAVSASASAAAQGGGAAPEEHFREEDDEVEDGVVMVMEDAADDVMDEGLRRMLEQLQNAVPMPPPPPAVAEVEEVVELSREALAAKTKAEIEELLREHGVPFKKSDAKAKLVEALLEALDASGEDEEAGDEGAELEQAVAAADK